MLPPEVHAAMSGLDLGTIDSVERIKHGLTNESWLMRTATDAVVVRVSNAAEVALQIDRRSEAVILDAVARAGIGPPVLVCDPTRHVLVTRYAGATWTAEQATTFENIGRVAALLRRLHELQPPEGTHVVDLAAVTRDYLHTLDEYGVAPAIAATEMRARAARIAALLNDGRTARLCHNDVHALNLVDDGTLRLIDWEYAGLGDPLFDLASICVYHRYTQAQREHLLDGYLEVADVHAHQRLDLCCWLFDYIRELWMEVRGRIG